MTRYGTMATIGMWLLGACLAGAPTDEAAAEEPGGETTSASDKRTPGTTAPEIPDYREHGKDPWMPRPTARSAARVSSVGVYRSIQVNVDEFGSNIVRDAANEPSIAVSPVTGSIVIGWRQFDHVSSDCRRAGVGFSSDGGETWTANVLDPGAFRSDPVIDVTADGVFHYLSLFHDDGTGVALPCGATQLHYGCDLWRGVEALGNIFWGDPEYVFGGDKPWFAVDRTGGIGHGNIYCHWQPNEDAWWHPDQFYRRTSSVSTSVLAEADARFGTVHVAPDGTVYIGGVSTHQNWLDDERVLRSTSARDPAADPTFERFPADLGGTVVYGNFPNPNGLLGQVWVSSDPVDSEVVYMLASVEPDECNNPLDVHFIRSIDGGKHWSFPRRVNDDPADPTNAWQWFGTMSVAPNGRIDAIWNDTRNADDPHNPDTSELYYTCSFDQGRLWLPNVAVSQPFEHGLGYPGGNRKLGDYYDMVSEDDGVHVAYAATHNGEQDVYYLWIPALERPRYDQPISYDAVQSWMRNLQLATDSCDRPVQATEYQYGNSWQGRPLYAYRLPCPWPGPCPEVRPKFLITAAQHGREWLSTNMVMYFGEQLLSRYDTDPRIQSLLDTYDVWLVPVVNPDGYEFGRTVERSWRKTRSENPGSTCVGTDPDQNWDWSWGGPGAIFDPCSPDYVGAAPFSESETSSLAQFIASIENLAGHIEYNDTWWVDETGSEGLILWPWASTDAPTPDHDQFAAIATAMAEEAQSYYGDHFEIAPYYEFFTETHGAMMDWVYGTRGVPSYYVNLSMGNAPFAAPSGAPDPMFEANVAIALVFMEEIGAPCDADINGNGEVGFADLTQLLSAWGPCVLCSEDLNGDEEVGFADLTTLLGDWGPCGV